MRFHGLLLVRDEDDIIEETIRQAFKWIDTVWVLDTGSTDETPAILETLSREFHGLNFLGRHPLRFDQSIRSFLFHEARNGFTEGDWIVKLDADEFYHIEPPEFVNRFVQPSFGVVDLTWYYFRLTEAEADAYESGNVDPVADRQRPISERRRYFKMATHREPRLFRYRETMRFAAKNNAPSFAGPVCPHPIPVRHYPHRDPLQMKKRFALRSAMMSSGSSEGGHWKSAEWRNDLVRNDGSEKPNSSLATQAGHTDGPLLYWNERRDLPDRTMHTLETKGFKQLIKRLYYPRLASIADRFANQFDEPDMMTRRRL
jgi:hypothetical protein